MRVTQGMLTASNLKYISQNYERLGDLQDQLTTGKKITRPSQDPVIAMKGMRYRSEVVEVEQFKRNLSEGFTWMDTADESLGQAGDVLHRIRELMVQASNDTYDPKQRANVAEEINQLEKHLEALANARVSNKYIFNGTDTADKPINLNKVDLNFDTFVGDLANAKDYIVSYKGKSFQYDPTTSAFVSGNDKIEFDTAVTPVDIKYTFETKLPYRDGEPVTETKSLKSEDLVITHNQATSTNNQDVEIEVMSGVTVPINVRSQEAFSPELFSGIESIKKMLQDPETTGDDLSNALDEIDTQINGILSTRANLGARVNRLEMTENRLLSQEVVAKKVMSENEDVDLEKVIIDLTTAESIHRAALAAGARIIQPTLMDFLR